MSKVLIFGLIVLLLLNTLTVLLEAERGGSEWFGTVYVRFDGRVEPSDAPIVTYDRVVYTLKADILSDEHGIIVEKDGIILDGGGYRIRGRRKEGYSGVYLFRVRNVTVTNLVVENFSSGVWLFKCVNCTVRDSRIAYAKYGVWLTSSTGSKVSSNVLEGNEWGIGLVFSSSNKVEGNVATSSYAGIYLINSSNGNVVQGNNVSGGEFGIVVYSSLNNTLIGNSVAGNRFGILLEESQGCIIRDNAIEGNFDGLVLSKSPHNAIIGNIVSANQEFGVWLYNSSGNTIRGNIIAGSLYGLYLKEGSNGNLVEANLFSNCSLYLRHSYRNTVVDNLVNGKPLIYLESISHATVRGAVGQVVLVRCNDVRVESVNILRATVGILFVETNRAEVVESSVSESYVGIEVWSSSGVIVNSVSLTGNRVGVDISGQSVNNLVNGSRVTASGLIGILLFDNCSNNTISWNIVDSNPQGIALVSSSHNTVCNNTVTNNSFGVFLQKSSYNIVRGNRLVGNGDGIHLCFSSTGNIIERNLVKGNMFGIRLSNSSGNSLSENLLEGNQIGMRFAHSSENTIAWNGFLRNTIQADSFDSVNTWDHGYPQGGNYWSDYRGGDFYRGPGQNEPEGDGIGDTPYGIDVKNRDRYPLMFLKQAVAWYGDKPPVCAVKSLKDEGERAEAIVGEPLEVYLGDSSDDIGIRRIRFTSYVVSDSVSREEQSGWYFWEASYGNWDPYRKVATFTFTTPGTVELRAEVEDYSGQVSECHITFIVRSPTPARNDALARILLFLAIPAVAAIVIAVLIRKKKV